MRVQVRVRVRVRVRFRVRVRVRWLARLACRASSYARHEEKLRRASSK